MFILAALVGALLFVLLMWLSGEYMTANGQWGLNVLQTADHKVHHTFIEAVCLGIPRKPDGMSGSMDELFWPQPDGQSVHYGAAGRDVCCQRF